MYTKSAMRILCLIVIFVVPPTSYFLLSSRTASVSDKRRSPRVQSRICEKSCKKIWEGMLTYRFSKLVFDIPAFICYFFIDDSHTIWASQSIRKLRQLLYRVLSPNIFKMFKRSVINTYPDSPCQVCVVFDTGIKYCILRDQQETSL